MKTADIVVGTEYAYKRWSTPEKVTVLRTGVKGKIGIRWNAPTLTNLVEVEADGKKFLSQPKDIVSTWAEHKKEQRRASRHRTEAKKRRQALRERRAQTAMALHEALLAKGVKFNPEEPATVFSSEDEQALVAVGMPVFEDEYFGRPFATPVRGLDDLMDDGHVDAEDVAIVLGLRQVAA